MRSCQHCGQPVPVRPGPATCTTCQQTIKREYWRAYRRMRKTVCICGNLMSAAARVCKTCALERTCTKCGTYVSEPGETCRYCSSPLPIKRPHNQGGHCGPGCTEKAKHSHCRGDGTGKCGWVLPVNEKQCEHCRKAQKRHELRARNAEPWELDPYRERYHPTAGKPSAFRYSDDLATA